ncbi:unnamed protein product [Miscanthus lutarioriparius]|uniref:F-box domain-containing protein n=1 Tax=Miscanthus lutarioriparius TaxID=422564 RepID=A0A811PTL0_9POAL|nr:unnamed protein product [Miscanthus lutarioriparius]
MLLSSPQSGGGDSCERRRDHTGDLRQVRSCFFLTSPSINRYKPSAPSHHFPGPQRPPLLTGMTPRERAKVDGAPSPPDADGDRISALPDDALHHVLSFLPAEDVMPCGHACSPGAGAISGILGSTPSLKEAFARDHIWDCGNDDCFSFNGVIPDESNYKNKCFLLQGLSEAENLALMCDYNGVVFHRDLLWCPTFNNLRTLLLNEWWCLDPDFYGLNLILKHSPVLEKLNLHLFAKGPQHKVEMIGRYNQMERSATILKHLKEIEVKCDVVNEQLHKVLKFLGTFGILELRMVRKNQELSPGHGDEG